jgi:addiction module HigA family antidote
MVEQVETLGPIHPGEILRAEFLEPLSMSAYRLAKGTGMTESAVGDILHGKRGITAATALRFSRFLGCSPEFWLNLQAGYDLDVAREQLNDRLESIEPADLDELHRQRMQDLEQRRLRLHAALPGELERLKQQLAKIERVDLAAV